MGQRRQFASDLGRGIREIQKIKQGGELRWRRDIRAHIDPPQPLSCSVEIDHWLAKAWSVDMLDLWARLYQFQRCKAGLKQPGIVEGGFVLTHFDFADLRLFIHIAQENSLTRGAERVHMSLPAASTRIKNLEEALGAKLLYRASNGVTLTPPGQVLLQHALDVQRQMEHLCSDLQEYAQGVKGHVRLFANTTAITEFLPGVLSRSSPPTAM